MKNLSAAEPDREWILFLCRSHHLWGERAGYKAALERKGYDIAVLPDGSSRLDLPELLSRSPEGLRFVLHPESPDALMPRGLPDVSVPTACFHIDTMGTTERRIRWAALFDRTFVFHPGFDKRYATGGHPHASYMPVATDANDFLPLLGRERDLELGWVGEVEGPMRARRRRILPVLAERFRMNDWAARHTRSEMVDVYTRSQIVVNISRDDWPQDANLRVYEAMAAGALLVTGLPTELEGLGFFEGRHFVGYEDVDDIPELVAHYLDSHSERDEIAYAGHRLVLAEHTYDNRADRLVELMRQPAHAPARGCSRVQEDTIRLDYFVAHRRWNDIFPILLALLVRSPLRVGVQVCRLGSAAVRRKLGRRRAAA